MKKILLFLITFLGINIFSLVNVNASNFSFYEGNYIDGIYVTKEKGGIKYYQKARFFMLNNYNKEAYCIEPFAMFNENGLYQGSLTADNLNNEQMKQIKNIINFGYKYGNHYDEKWYAITQFMVWQVADPTGEYYFTDGLNGNKIIRFQDEINEINSLIEEYNRLPSIANANIDIVENQKITLVDQNYVLSKYIVESDNATIENNKLIINELKEGNHKIHLYRKEFNSIGLPVFYNSTTSQNMAINGDLEQIDIYIHINVSKTSIEITKIDSHTKTTIPSGDAILKGAKYQLLDSNKNEIAQLVINEEMKTKIENLEYGTYYIKEIEAGIGYQLDSNIYEINITKDTPTIELSLENKVIEKEVEIHKSYGEDNVFKNEEGISFDIIDSKDNLFETITTDNNGIATTILPYGKYIFRQRNSTYGYETVEDFQMDITDNIKERKELYDYKIKVPNTYTESTSKILIILFLILEVLYVKKMVLY